MYLTKYNKNNVAPSLLDIDNWDDVFSIFSNRYPPVAYKVENNKITLELELPRFKPEEVKVKYKGGILSINAEKLGDSGRVYREYRINEEVNPATVTAKLEYGVLTITLPLKTEPENVIAVQ